MLNASPQLAEDNVDNSGFDNVRESREILSAIMQQSPGEVSRNSDSVVNEPIVEQAMAAVRRRANGEPLAYCVGSAAFRHLVLHVDRRVLIPRPETELVVDHALRVVGSQPGGIAIDIGTGSGAIALSLCTEGRFDRVVATDISREALEVASMNAQRITCSGTVMEFRQGPDFEPLSGVKARVIVSNPPYISHDESASLPASVREWEPAVALFADDDGMARYDALLKGAKDHLEPDGWLVLEVDARRAHQTLKRAQASGHYSQLQLARDLAGRERVLIAQLGRPLRSQ